MQIVVKDAATFYLKITCF